MDWCTLLAYLGLLGMKSTLWTTDCYTLTFHWLLFIKQYFKAFNSLGKDAFFVCVWPKDINTSNNDCEFLEKTGK